jgi:hypothetical protein
MSNLTILSDAELDAVSGGDQNATGGAGGAGGTGGIVGANVSSDRGGRTRVGGGADLSVDQSSANGGRGGNGGSARIINR